jgi:hypothetical protein
MKRRGRFGEELSGYSLTKRVDRALVRELALPEELFLKKFSGEGFLTKEKLSVAEGAYYILIDKCLDGKTEVLMSDGEWVKIEEISKGDRVVSVDFVESKSKIVVVGKRIKEFDVSMKKPVLKESKVVRVVEGGFREVLKIVTPYGVIRATPNHVIPTHRWGKFVELPAEKFRWMDFIFCYDGKDVVLSNVIDVKPDGKAKTFDITLEDHNHFIANGIVVHNSGSMHGEKTIWARSVALAIYRMAKVKRRRYFLRFFDKRTYHLLDDPEEVVDAILKVKSNGGTDITNALKTAIRDLIEKGLSDLTNTIVIITDGEDVVEDLSKELKKANANLISVMIQGDNETLKAISHSYMKAELSEVGGLKLLKVVEVS